MNIKLTFFKRPRPHRDLHKVSWFISEHFHYFFTLIIPAVLFTFVKNYYLFLLFIFFSFLIFVFSFFHRFFFVRQLSKRSPFTFERRLSGTIVEGQFFNYDLIVTNTSSSRTPPFFLCDHSYDPPLLNNYRDLKKFSSPLDYFPARFRRFFKDSRPLSETPFHPRSLHFSALLSDLIPFEGQVPSLAPGESFILPAQSISFYPGLRQFEGVDAFFSDPLFVVHRSFSFQLPQTFVVLPDVLSDQFSLPSPLSDRQFSSLNQFARSYDGDHIRSLRAWRYGDSIKRIDWKASARLGSFITREYDECLQHQPLLGVVFDPTLPSSLSTEYFYQTLRATRTYLSQMQEAHCSFNFLIAHSQHSETFSSQTQNLRPWIESLASTPSQTTFHPEILNAWIAQHSFSSLCFITPHWTPEHSAWIQSLKIPPSSVLIIFISNETDPSPQLGRLHPLFKESFL